MMRAHTILLHIGALLCLVAGLALFACYALGTQDAALRAPGVASLACAALCYLCADLTAPRGRYAR